MIWIVIFTTEKILSEGASCHENLVALNAECAEEEHNGVIRWLRPDYQPPVEAIAPSFAGINPHRSTHHRTRRAAKMAHQT